jgi:hypothetical protein
MRMKKYLSLVLVAMFALFLVAPAILLPVDAVYADTITAEELFGGTMDGDDFASTAGLGTADLTETIAAFIRVGLGFLGVVAVIIVMIGGFKWMIAGGDEGKITKAKQYIFGGITGLVIILSAYAIANFVITQLTSAIT